jgi:hypothetical protein
MVFSYYSRLKPAQQRIYRRSDKIRLIALPATEFVQPMVTHLAEALRKEDRKMTAAIAQELSSALTAALEVPAVAVQVLDVRPSHHWGELHGLYTPAENNRSARITLWMRTAKRRSVVAFRTFLRTLVHELCHHLDYELLRLEDSFHTEGFYKRESSVMHQLVGHSGTRAGMSQPSPSKVG